MTLLARIGRLFPRNDATETIATTVHFDAPPDAVWRAMLFYEEVPRRPMPLLRAFLPVPVRTRGDKTRVGATIECVYDGGYLRKRMTLIEPPSVVRFEVLEQALGVEDCISMTEGAYELRPLVEGGTEVVMKTTYRGHLRPRCLWRPLEKYLAHRVHHHIFRGMRVAIASGETRILPAGLAEEPS